MFFVVDHHSYQGQYIFTHDALLEYIQSDGDTEVKDTNISKYYEDLLQPCTTNPTETLLERQFIVRFYSY